MSHVSLPAKYSGETVDQTFDFTSRLAIGETITSAATTATVYSGTDPNPSGVISGGANWTGGVVTQAFTGGITGVAYNVLCTATTSAGQVLELSGILTVLPTAT